MPVSAYADGVVTGIGIITPYDFALDRELWRWTPDSATLHLTRLPFTSTTAVTTEMVTALGDDEHVAGATRAVMTVQPAVVAYACTSGSFVNGIEGDRKLTTGMTNAGAPAAITTSGALLEAFHALGRENIAIATPYTRDLTDKLEGFIEASGRHVVGVADLGLRTEIWTLPYREVAALVRAADRPSADAVVISCTNVPTYDVIPMLEQELGKPVISANQATMWAALRHAGLSAIGVGQRLCHAREFHPSGAAFRYRHEEEV